MESETETPWSRLFTGASAPGGHSVQLQWRVLRKHGHPLLLLPEKLRSATHALELYPAQTRLARAIKSALRVAVPLGFLAAAQRTLLSVPSEDGFLRFLAELIGVLPEQLPTPALLAGNPAVAGRRFVLLLFNAQQQPVAVAKAGASPPARQLIRGETDILSKLPPDLRGRPRLLSTFESQSVQALALEYCTGDSPRTHDPQQIASVLSSWVDGRSNSRLAEIPAWCRLVQSIGEVPSFRQVAAALESRTVHPAIYHGDFAPWNIKVTREGQTWKVLDWERGELVGVPAWDWFHYVIQNGILVRHLPVRALVAQVDSLLASAPFVAYAEKAGLVGLERPLVIAYLAYNAEVLRPAEGLETGRQLLEVLMKQWLAGPKPG